MVSTEVERHTGVDTADVPSAAWGWSTNYPRLFQITGLLMAGFLLLMIKGNHVGRVEDWTLVGFAALIVVIVIRDWLGRRRGSIR